jgi:hypothetical protein
MRRLQGSDLAGLGALLVRRALVNLVTLLTPSAEQPMQTLLRYEFLFVLIASAVTVSRSASAAARDRFVLYLTTITLFALLVVGDVEGWRDYRVLGPILLCALLVGVAGGARWPVWLAVMNVLAAPVAVRTFVSLHQERFVGDRTKIEYFRRDVAPLIRYDPDLPGWGNTVLLHVDAYENHLLGLPAGMGLTAAMHWDQLQVPFKSRYILVRPIDRDHLPQQMRLHFLGGTVAGAVYENLDWRRTR